VSDVKKPGFIFIIFFLAFESKAQPGDCTFKSPQYIIHFGSGNIKDPNSTALANYQRVYGSCPTDGHYSFAPFTSACFSDDWHTLTADHTAGDKEGNMLLVNAAPDGGTFLNMPVSGLKSNTLYELGLWVINLCKPTKKCPAVLLPSIIIRLVTPEGKIVASIVTKDLPRVPQPVWSQQLAYFTTPASASSLRLVMADNAPGGCGNDFALDDITFRECVKLHPQPVAIKKKKTTIKRITAPKPVTKVAASPQRKIQPVPVMNPKHDTVSIAAVKPSPKVIVPTPLVLKNRENALVRKIETGAGVIRINCYDNGEIDGDTVSIYHNNKLIKSRMGLSDKPISFTLEINAAQPHHELITVAENLGSIPPNTSVMIIYTPNNRYEVFISSTRQKNALVVFDLKK
jgi:hypothetical protein